MIYSLIRDYRRILLDLLLQLTFVLHNFSRYWINFDYHSENKLIWIVLGPIEDMIVAGDAFREQKFECDRGSLGWAKA